MCPSPQRTNNMEWKGDNDFRFLGSVDNDDDKVEEEKQACYPD